MGKLTLVTGGARSGKSTYAEKLVKEEGENVVYVATAIPFDEGMRDRIKKHKAQRRSDWKTIERYKNFDIAVSEGEFDGYDTVLLDCMTIMVTNLMFEDEVDYETLPREEIDFIEKKIVEEIDKLLTSLSDKNLVIVTNEVGLGIVPDNRLSRIYRDFAGRINQVIAKRANRVYMAVCGIPMKVKGE